MEIDALQFWQRVETLWSETGLTKQELCKLSGGKINYYTWSNKKSQGIMPNTTLTYAFAKQLHTSVEYLLTGEGQKPLTPEAEAVMQNTRLQTIVAALLASPDKLSAIETLLGVKQVPPNVKSLA